jgi:hypothetical protein
MDKGKQKLKALGYRQTKAPVAGRFINLDDIPPVWITVTIRACCVAGCVTSVTWGLAILTQWIS